MHQNVKNHCYYKYLHPFISDCIYLHTLPGNPKYLFKGIPGICCRNTASEVHKEHQRIPSSGSAIYSDTIPNYDILHQQSEFSMHLLSKAQISHHFLCCFKQALNSVRLLAFYYPLQIIQIMIVVFKIMNGQVLFSERLEPLYNII